MSAGKELTTHEMISVPSVLGVRKQTLYGRLAANGHSVSDLVVVPFFVPLFADNDVSQGFRAAFVAVLFCAGTITRLLQDSLYYKPITETRRFARPS